MAFLHSNGAALHYQVQGEGVPVIALHASASTGAQWRSLVGYIEGRFRIFTPDLPGYGRSDPLPRTMDGLGGDAEAIAGLIDAIGEPVHLVGHSYGGAVALKLAAMRPEAVRSLTVIEPVAFHLLRDGPVSDRLLFTEFTALASATIRQAGRNRIGAIRGFIDYWNGAGAWSRTSAGLRGFFLSCLERVCADLRAVMAEEGTRGELARITCPALAVMGLDSPPAVLRVTEVVAEALPHGALRLIPGAGHQVPLTDPHIVDPMIAGHLVAADRATARRAAIAA